MIETKTKLVETATQFLAHLRGLPLSPTYQQLKASLTDARGIIQDLLIELLPPSTPKATRKKLEVKADPMVPGVNRVKQVLFESPINRPWWGPFLVALHTAQQTSMFTSFEVELSGDVFDPDVGMLSDPMRMMRFANEEAWRTATADKVPVLKLSGWRIE